jgi:GNAT superfamily N-acetyltransferase
MDAAHDVHAELEQRGFVPDREAPFFQHCVRSLRGELPEVALAAGFEVHDVSQVGPVRRAAAHRRCWSVLPFTERDALVTSSMTSERYERVMATWPYRAELDLVVVDPLGDAVAGAIGWIDEVNASGELEPVGVDPAFRRLGLGRAVSIAALDALRRAGAERAVVYPRGDAAYPVPMRLYSSIGFAPVSRTVTYLGPRHGGDQEADPPSTG